MRVIIRYLTCLCLIFSSVVYADTCPDLSHTANFSSDVWKIQSGAPTNSNNFYETTTRKLDDNRVYIQCFYSNSNGGYGFVLISENPVETPNKQANWQLSQNQIDYKCTSTTVNHCEFVSIKNRHTF